MPRRSSGGRPARSASARPAPMRNPLQQASPAPAPAPVQEASVQGGSVLGGVGSMVAEGLAWGAGNSVAHRVVDAVMGPSAPIVANMHVDADTVNVGTVFPSAPPVAAAQLSGPVVSDGCNAQSKAFQDCINNYGDDISKCQFYIDMLNECRRDSATVVRAE